MRLLGFIACAIALVGSPTAAIYEDQAGELDWSIENVGRVVAAAFGGDKRGHSAGRGTTRALYVASDGRSRALARLDSKTGDTKWRRVLHRGDDIDAIQLTNYGLLSLSGGGQNVRLWDATDGALLWESVVGVRSPDALGGGNVVPIGDDRVAVVSMTSIALLNLKDGAVAWNTGLPMPLESIIATILSSDGSSVFVLGWSKQHGHQLRSVVLSTGNMETLPVHAEFGSVTLKENEKGQAVLVVIRQDNLRVKSLENGAQDADVVETKVDELSLPSSKTPLLISGIEHEVRNSLVVRLSGGKRMYAQIKQNLRVDISSILPSDGIVVESLTGESVIFHVATVGKSGFQVASYSSAGDQPQLQWNAEIDVSLHGGSIRSAFLGCPGRKKELGSLKCRAVVVMEDDGLVMSTNEEAPEADSPVDSKNVLWTREEALANVRQVQWITPAETEIEKQTMKGVPTFVEELQLEVDRLKHAVDRMISMSSTLFEPTPVADDRTRKEPVNSHFFGFSKLAILLTDSGRLFAFRAETKVVAWSAFVGQHYRLFVTRDHPAIGSGAELVLVSNTSSVILVDGDDGHVTVTTEGLPSGQTWSVLLPRRKHHIDEDATTRRGVALVSKETLEVTIWPADTTHLGYPEAENFYFYHFDDVSSTFNGFTLEGDLNHKLRARQVWSIVVPEDQLVVARSHQSDNTVVDSSVTITGDDSLLLKYLNPHMFGFATLSTETLDPNDKNVSVLHISLVDAVSGRLIHRVRHMHGAQPVCMVQSENWVVYSFWNEKEKRMEVVSLSLFDGAVGTHSLNLWKRPSWSDYRSSFDPRAPFVLQKSFVFPARISTLGVTVTSRGITPQYVLVGMENGQIYKLPRLMIDPRQPEKPPTPEEQEEGLTQYSPLIPMHNHLEATITYNKTVTNLVGISTTPVELESTTLVLGHGLDLFYVRLAPAKAFDVLPPDFNYELLVLLCLGFLGTTFLVKTLAQRKALNEAWK